MKSEKRVRMECKVQGERAMREYKEKVERENNVKKLYTK